MLSKSRKPLGNVEPNRLHQHQSKQPHHHRRRPPSKGTASNDSNSVASLVDDSEFEFLTNPKPSPKQVGTSNEQSDISLTGAWNSSSKTPKISNVTAMSLPEKVDCIKKVTREASLSQFPQVATSTSANAMSSNISEIACSAPRQIKKQLIEKGVGHKESAIQWPSLVGGFRKQSRHRANYNSKSEGNVGTFQSNVSGGLLETIKEGSTEEENDSPFSVDRIENKESGGESRFDVSSDIASNEKENTTRSIEQRVDNFANSSQENEAFENTSDMDVSSDDELMGLTLSPPVPVMPLRKLSDDQLGKKDENSMRTDLSSPPNDIVDDVPVQRSHCRIQQGEHFHTPTQTLIMHVSGIAKKSTPHPAKNSLPHTHHPNRSHSVNSKQGDSNVNMELRPLTEQLRQDRKMTKTQQRNIDLTPEPKPPRNDRMKRHGTNEGVLGISSSASTIKAMLHTPTLFNTKSNDNITVDKYQISTPACSKVRKTIDLQCSPSKLSKGDSNNNPIGAKTIIIHSPRENNANVDPVNKEVWRAVMGIPTAAESSLVGLIIETPHIKEQSDLGESESIDGSELTHDTYFLLNDTSTHNQLKINSSGNTERQPEHRKLIKGLFVQPDTVQGEPSTNIDHITKQKSNSKEKSIDDAVAVICESVNKDCRDKSTSNTHVMPDHRLNNNIIDSVICGNVPHINRTPEHVTVDMMELHTPHSMAVLEPARSNSRDGKVVEPVAGKTGHEIHSSPPAQRIFQLLQGEVHTGILSHRKAHRMANEAKPTLWTSEIAGRKFKAFGVNAAPVFKLFDGKYYQHPPLPPGWAIAVSRSQNIPFYIHPDFGATFYSPVPLPSIDGTTAGTTLLYQADTPLHPKLWNVLPNSPTPSTPIVFGAQTSQRLSDDTSTVVTQHFNMKRLDSPKGAFIVASSTYFSESQNEAVSNVALQRQMIGMTPASTSDYPGYRQPSCAHNLPSCSSSNSADSSTTVAEPSSQFSKSKLPREIQIITLFDDLTDDDRFRRDLEKTSASLQLQSSVGPQSVSKSKAYIDSADKSLEWGTELSPGSDESKVIEGPNILHQDSDMYSNGVATPSEQVLTNLNESYNASPMAIVMIDDNPSPLELMNEDDFFDSVPHHVAVPPEVNDDDMSLLQCSPQHGDKAKILPDTYQVFSKHSRFPHPTGESNLILGNGDDQSTNEDCSYASTASRSYLSVHSSKSRISCRSLYPKLPLCSLQYLHIITMNGAKRKKTQKRKTEKRPRTNG